MIRLPGYTFTEEIYRGQRSVICRAVRQEDGEPVIVKSPVDGLPADQDVRRYRREYEIGRLFAAAGVAPADRRVIAYHALLSHEHGIFLVLEDFAGVSLAEVVPAEGLAIEAFLRVAVRLAEGLAAIHRQGVVHRDVKPRNAVVSRDFETLRYIDFSASSQLTEERRRGGRLSELEGTLSYMSPEQTGRMNRGVDQRSDLYSLGVTFYELLTGQVPFTADDTLGLIHCHLARSPVPPVKVRPSVPRPVSEIVEKLMAKSAESRYQSSEGVQADLLRCTAELAQGGAIPKFRLGTEDRRPGFWIPQKLYGREKEVAALQEAFDRLDRRRSAGGTGVEILLISGSSGVGKSALAYELLRPVTGRRGIFVAGKYERSRRDIPYSGIRQTLATLCDHLQSEPAADLLRWRQRLLDALGQNAGIMTAALPELECLLGEQGPGSHSSPQEEQNRFHLACLRFVAAVAGGDQPLVMLLDDLQWMDPASLKLLEGVVKDQEVVPWLFLGTYRDNEIDLSHPWLRVMAEIKEAGGSVTTLHLGNLAPGDVLHLVAETLSLSAEEVRPLAELVSEKTGGNAFFTAEFLQSLHREGLLQRTRGRWRWDVEQIRARDVTENVVELVAGRIDQLVADARTALRLAACLGSTFDLITLGLAFDACRAGARALGAQVPAPLRRYPAARAAEVLRCLWPAIRAGLVFPVDGRALDLLYDESGEGLDCRFKFAHDRVQQAAYGSFDAAEREELHLEIGRRLAAVREGDDAEERLFETVHQWNRALRRITKEGERIAVASLNLAAGRKARRATAYREAAAYLRAGASLLPQALSGSHDRLLFELKKELAEAEYLSGRFEEAEEIFTSLMRQARSQEDRFEVLSAQLGQYQLQGRYVEGIELSRKALRTLDIELPESNDEIRELWQAGLRALREHLAERRIAELVEAPRMRDKKSQRLMRLLTSIATSAIIANEVEIYVWSIVERVRLSLQYGNDENSSLGYVSFGIAVSRGLLGNHDEAYAFGELGVELAKRFDNLPLRGRARMVFYLGVHHWKKPLSSSVAPLRKNYQTCVEAGDLLYAAHSVFFLMSAQLISGCPLAEIRDEAERYMPFLRRTNAAYLEGAIKPGVLQPLANLIGATKHPSRFDDQGFDEEEFLRTAETAYYLAVFYSAKIRSFYYFGFYHAGYSLCDKVEMISQAIPSHAAVPEMHFFVALTLAAILTETRAEERSEREELLQEYRDRLREWAEHGAPDHLHRYLLIEAERERLAGEPEAAAALFERAIAAAREQGYLNHEALGNELYGRFWLGRGDREIATVYLRRARALYARWGATAKVADLEKRHRDLDLWPPERSGGVAAAGGTTRHLDLDLGAVLEASQVISGEIRMERLLRSMMQIILVTAGARRGCLVLEHQGELRVEAEVDPAQGPMPVLQGTALETHRGISHAVVRHVMESGGELVLDDAMADERFGADPYVLRNQVRSLLCLPLRRPGEIAGLVYLENDLVSHAFPAERVEVLRALIAQAAISLENASLYRDLEKEVEERRRTEAQLRSYAAALEEKNTELERFNYTVSHDLKSPLVTIKGFLGLLQREVDRTGSEPLHHYLTRIGGAADEMARLLEGLHELSRVSRVQNPPEEVATSELAREAVDALAVPIAERGVDVEIDPTLPPVFGDRVRISHALRNLLENAIKFLDEQPRPRIVVGHRADGEETVFFVRDNGRGIEAPYQKRIFNLFEQLDQQREGTGIGLTLVQRIVEDHGGRVWVESPGRGQGSSFCFTLPSPKAAA